jgi:hypothetical protein
VPESPSEYPGLEVMLNKMVDRDLAPMMKVWKEELKRGEIGFISFIFHYGEGGGIAYAASIDRNDAIRSLTEWLRHEGPIQFPFMQDFFDFLYLATRKPEDKDYDREFVMNVRRKGFPGR